MRDWSFKEWLIVVAFVAAAVGLLLVIMQTASAAPANGKGANTQCQYPFRELTANGSCDNSDPADPAAVVKGAPENVTSQNVPDTELPQFTVDKTVDSVDNSNFQGK